MLGYAIIGLALVVFGFTAGWWLRGWDIRACPRCYEITLPRTKVLCGACGEELDPE
jgi:hypothetical protein